ncbi:MAG: SDR family NAD(P)-dependent oxidoreductase, partial [Alphaproteobacteria bacterium]|nr:SDR family NAD(P)-dependent oxidoreductase [Alphaproteobacteria bacterium]
MAQVPAGSGTGVRHWLVTGASRGIGHAVAALACSRGDKVCLVSRSAEITDVAARLGENAMGIAADVTNVDDLTRLASQISTKWG